MPCETKIADNQTLQQRMTQVQKALQRLEASLTSGNVKVNVGANGAVAFSGWKDRDDVTDVCAYRTLSANNSWALRQAVAKAEAMSGRKVNASAVAVGTHSHDGGSTWHKGH
jgi:DNA-binding protein YbaB